MNKHRPLTLAGLRAFESLARRLSFSAVAEELFVTQSAVSRQIKALEEEIGAPLFTRGTRHVEITGDGQLLLAAVAPLLAKLDAGVRQIRRTYDAGAATTIEGAWEVEARDAAAWQRDFDPSRVAARRAAIIERGRSQG